MIGLSFQHMVVQEPAVSQIEKNLKQEYDLITVMPDASLIDSTATHKTDLAIVGGYFNTKITFEEVREYYDKQLINKGWNFLKENKKIIPYNGHKYEARVLYYRKGDYMARIENPGVNDKEDTFAFFVTWGMEPGSSL